MRRFFSAAAPRAFYAGYGVALGSDPSLLNELRAPGAALAQDSLEEIMKRNATPAAGDTAAVRAPVPSWSVLAGEVLLGTALAAGAVL